MKLFPILLFSTLMVSMNIPSDSCAANIYIGDSHFDRSKSIIIEGEIKKGGLEQLKKNTLEVVSSEGFKELKVYLDSQGGDVLESMKMGNFLREMLATTYAHGYLYHDINKESGKSALDYKNKNPESAQFTNTIFRDGRTKPSDKEIKKCYSSCVFIFLGGVKRDSSDNEYFKDHDNEKSIPIFGIHRPYYDSEYFSKLTPSEARSSYRKLEKTTREYLIEMGTSNELIERIFNKPSNEIELILNDEFEKYYKKNEPYYEEWLISKCGSTGAKNIFTTEELEDFTFISRQGIRDAREKGLDLLEYDEKYGKFVPDGFSKEQVDSLYQKLISHNMAVHSCRKSAVVDHQKNWVSNYLKSQK